MTKTTTRNKCTSFAGLFDGHADAWMQCCLYPLMQLVQSYTGSLWTPQLGNFLLPIAPATARATGNTTTIKKCTHFAGYFDGYDSVQLQYCMHPPIEEV
jgi:hypothetical protein